MLFFNYGHMHILIRYVLFIGIYIFISMMLDLSLKIDFISTIDFLLNFYCFFFFTFFLKSIYLCYLFIINQVFLFNFFYLGYLPSCSDQLSVLYDLYIYSDIFIFLSLFNCNFIYLILLFALVGSIALCLNMTKK